MATAPTVQTLDQIMAELQPGYQGQRQVIGKAIANTNETYKASELALDAAKTQGFNQINEQATGKGTAFGGIPVEEQAEYLSTKYLPGKQAAKAKQQEDILTLEGQNAALDTDIRNKAFDTRNTQVGSLNQWNLQQEAQRAAAEAARIERDFQASQAEKNRAHEAAQNAANRAASAAANAPKQVSPSQAALTIISQGLGGDGFVSPSTFQLARDMYRQAGGDAGKFASEFWKYTGAGAGQKNQSNWKSYYYG
jgi:hypothetical protein